MREERYHIALDKYDKNIVINALNTLRTRQLQEERPTEPVDELISKVAHAPTKKVSQDVIDLLTKASRHYQQTILMITHNNGLTSMVDRVLRVTDGVLTDLGGNANEKLS